MKQTIKICNRCTLPKMLNEFGIRKDGALGLRAECTSCRSEVYVITNHTLAGLVRRIYFAQRASSTHRGHALPTYSKDQLHTWLLSQPNFDVIYAAWVKSGFNKQLRPSIDRKDDYIGYTIANIQLMTWRENAEKGIVDRKSGKNTKLCRSIVQLDVTNKKELQTFRSIKEAGESLNIDSSHIGKCCRGKGKTAGGFLWQYKN